MSRKLNSTIASPGYADDHVIVLLEGFVEFVSSKGKSPSDWRDLVIQWNAIAIPPRPTDKNRNLP